MTTLEAVNEILSRAGMRPVSSLDTGGSSWASQAETLLDRESLSILTEGWNFNLLKRVELSPDGSGYIQIPAEAIWVDTGAEDRRVSVGMRNGRLYNLTDNTDVFTSSLYVRYADRHYFQCIPHPIQEYIVARAAVELCQEANAGNTRLQMAMNNLRTKNSLARSHEGEVNNVNIVDSASAESVRGYRRPVYRSS